MAAAAAKTSKKLRPRVCLFGLSADPPTVAHVAIVQALLQKVEVQEIRILPVYRHMFAVRK